MFTSIVFTVIYTRNIKRSVDVMTVNAFVPDLQFFSLFNVYSLYSLVQRTFSGKILFGNKITKLWFS